MTELQHHGEMETFRKLLTFEMQLSQIGSTGSQYL